MIIVDFLLVPFNKRYLCSKYLITFITFFISCYIGLIPKSVVVASFLLTSFIRLFKKWLISISANTGTPFFDVSITPSSAIFPKIPRILPRSSLDCIFFRFCVFDHFMLADEWFANDLQTQPVYWLIEIYVENQFRYHYQSYLVITW